MEERLVVAGFGGQGVMAIGQLLTYAGMIENYNVSWLPSYGPEMRGGTANCSVIISGEAIGSPLVVESDSAIIMNKPSLDKFEKDVLPNGKLFIDSSLIDRKSSRNDIDVYYIPANEIANSLGNDKVSNMVMLGAYLEITNVVKIESVLKAFTKVFGERKAKFIPLNKEALEKGAEAVKNQRKVLV
ncbi:2-oxoacid:acceptor oxidoreductase family protein [Sporanaerobacter sp. PP17-6a]|jgi:2-oxoglutarate ferredoxin oxidoreductase subunit gamma|uniref:2-oxoacid:acceptor oxidoreductase family protein n=1 Tax=Sporanaerobacter sp. PP17-6a TaxID=1891289 RepID=UPI00089FF94E|nr:2-oxoacid:acceptor oxidoreductase family protein [Sporanaerobacter sp. PP17-6a]SCL94102.1 Pyruvate synthase subunit PorC [Sporanaerobacter sp. PP17-6a]